MKVNLTVYFSYERERENWKQIIQNQISIFMPKITYKMQDTIDYIGCNIIYNAGTKYNITATASKQGIITLKIGNKETGEECISEFHPCDYNIIDYNIICFD